MRKLIMITVFSVIANLLIAQTTQSTQTTQTSQTPNTVRDNFTKMYPDATNVYWKTEKNNYRVNYSDYNTMHSIVYDKDGNMMSQEVEMKAADMQMPKDK